MQSHSTSTPARNQQNLSGEILQVIQALLERPIAFQRRFVKIGGGVTAGLMLSQAWYWSSRTSNPEKWFYKTARQWEEETGLTRREQVTARRNLIARGLMEEKLQGVPAKLHFRVNIAAVTEALIKSAEAQTGPQTPESPEKSERQTSLHKSAKLACADQPNQFGGSVETISETTSESNSETTHTQTRLRAVGAPAEERVCVDGKFPLKTFERYARNQAGIRDPRAWANIHRKSGEWDEPVALWCAEHAIDPRTGDAVGKPGEDASLSAPLFAAPTVNPVDCPDCNGTGWRYPNESSKGVVKCRHERLDQQGAA